MNNSEDFKSYKNMDDWIRNRQFCDSEEVYTNGAELITVNDVLKGWNYYMNLTEKRARADAINAIKNDLHKRLTEEMNNPYQDQGLCQGLYFGIQRCDWYLDDTKEKKNE